MIKKINCQYNDQGTWCSHSGIKRSLFGLGARICRVFEDKTCEFQKSYPRPKPPLACPIKGIQL